MSRLRDANGSSRSFADNHFAVEGQQVALAGHWEKHPDYSHVGPFSWGRACVFDGKRNGYIDLQGRLVVPPKYRIATPYINGTAFVR